MAGQRIRINLKSFDNRVIDKSTELIVASVLKSGAKVAGPVFLPTKIKKFTVLKSPHVNVTARNQFEMRTHKRLIDIYDTTVETMNSLMGIQLPDGVDIKIEQ
jgi:small subunit ribosomal protein S10